MALSRPEITLEDSMELEATMGKRVLSLVDALQDVYNTLSMDTFHFGQKARGKIKFGVELKRDANFKRKIIRKYVESSRKKENMQVMDIVSYSSVDGFKENMSLIALNLKKVFEKTLGSKKKQEKVEDFNPKPPYIAGSWKDDSLDNKNVVLNDGIKALDRDCSRDQ